MHVSLPPLFHHSCICRLNYSVPTFVRENLCLLLDTFGARALDRAESWGVDPQGVTLPRFSRPVCRPLQLTLHTYMLCYVLSGWMDSNHRPLRPERSALANWATPRWSGMLFRLCSHTSAAYPMFQIPICNGYIFLYLPCICAPCRTWTRIWWVRAICSDVKLTEQYITVADVSQPPLLIVLIVISWTRPDFRVPPQR